MYVFDALKGVCHEIFYLHFLHDLNPSRPLINRLKYFRIRFRYPQDICIFIKLQTHSWASLNENLAAEER